MINRDNTDLDKGLHDKELIEKVKKGDEQAFHLLVKRYYNMVYYISIKALHDKEKAKDTTQEVFIKVWKNINSCIDGTYFVSWLTTITKNHCIDILRKENKSKEREISIEEIENKDKITSNTANSQVISKHIKFEYLNTFVEQLPESQRIVFQKRLDGWSVQEIANELKCPVGTVLSRFALAKKKIYELMKKTNLKLDDFNE